MKIKNSQVAGNQSSIINSKNNIKKKHLKSENIISFALGVLASLLASYLYENFIK